MDISVLVASHLDLWYSLSALRPDVDQETVKCLGKARLENLIKKEGGAISSLCAAKHRLLGVGGCLLESSLLSMFQV